MGRHEFLINRGNGVLILINERDASNFIVILRVIYKSLVINEFLDRKAGEMVS